MNRPPPAIGDAPEVQYKLIKESETLPDNRKAIVSTFEKILQRGGVQKVVVQLGKPIEVFRNVQKLEEDETVPEEVLEQDLFNAARNAEMTPFSPPSEEVHPLEYVRLAFGLFSRSRLKPKAFLIHQWKELFEWLGIDHTDAGEIFGVPVYQHQEMPDRAMLFMASHFDDTEVVIQSLRMEMWERK